ncbi:TolC family protein [Novosphingobium aquae]|uniref:TolC family protein n=1 Tax=Novosphingobium aquae TaxID=3133435 RepID=A0ABU8S988_9SPHN
MFATTAAWWMSGPVLADPGEKYGPPSPAQEAIEAKVIVPPREIPPALAAAAELAADDYPTVRNAKAQERAARSELGGAKWLRFPSLSLEALAVTRGNTSTSQNGMALNVTVEQPLFTFGKISGTIDKADALLLARRAGVDEAIRDLTLRVTNAYYSLGLSARRQDVLEESLAQHKTLLSTIQNRVRQEVSPQADLNLALSRASAIEQELSQAKAQRAISLSQLFEFVGSVGFDPGNVPTYDAALSHPSEVDAINEAITCDPKLQRLRAEQVAAQADAKVAKASIFPQLLGQLTHNDITGTRVGFALRAQTGAGLSQVAITDAARARADASGFAIATAERELRDALQLDFVTNSSSKVRITASALAADTSELVTESYRRQFIAGRRTWLDVMNAVREATSAKLARTDAEFGAMASSARILLRTCRWEPSSRRSANQDVK